MPQMSPLSWLLLYIMFTMIFFLYNIMLYYSFNPTPKLFNPIKIKKTFNWKW